MYQNIYNSICQNTVHYILLEQKLYLKIYWQVIKTIMNKRKYTPINTHLIWCEWCHYKLWKCYRKPIQHFLAKYIPPTDKNPIDYIQQDIIADLYFNPATENEIRKIVGSFKDNAAGWDDLKSIIIKHVRNSTTVPLIHICNRSSVIGSFLVDWSGSYT